ISVALVTRREAAGKDHLAGRRVVQSLSHDTSPAYPMYSQPLAASAASTQAGTNRPAARSAAIWASFSLMAVSLSATAATSATATTTTPSSSPTTISPACTTMPPQTTAPPISPGPSLLGLDGT